MPIKIDDDLPARQTLEAEGLIIMGQADAIRQDIRPLRIALLNLMPDKIKTETQIARLLGASPLQIELTLARISHHVSRNTSADHMASFYRPWTDVRNEKFDGVIITGAPVEHLPFEEVHYWNELQQVFEWTQTHVHRSLAICWAAQAALHHFHGVQKHLLDEKAFGVFDHHSLSPSSPWMRGFSDTFSVPVSRWSEIRRDDLPQDAGLQILAESRDTGLCLVNDPVHSTLCMFNHLEYDSHTLADEYARDAKGQLPLHYFPSDDPGQKPSNRWRSHAHLLFGNWIDEMYQSTPYQIADIGR